MRYIIATHGALASGFASALKLIVGQQEETYFIDFIEGKSGKDLANSYEKILAQKPLPTIIFTDVAGGTPFNQAVQMKQKFRDVHVIAGVNLPMLVEASFLSVLPIDECLPKLVKIGCDGIKFYEKKAKLQEEMANGI